MATLVPHILYHPPYGGQPILRKTGRAAYEAVVEFLTCCTDAQGDGRWGMIDVEYTGDAFMPDGWDAVPVTDALAKVLPVPTSEHSTYARPGGLKHHASWPVPPELHDWAVDFSLAAMKARRRYPDPVSYTCSVDFRLKVPPDGRALSGQDSRMETTLSIRSDIQLHVSSSNTSAFFELAFPFAEPGPEFVEYVAAIRPYLPIRLARGNFKHWTVNKAGTDYRIRRIDKSVLASVP